jgi:hypothetical protein
MQHAFDTERLRVFVDTVKPTDHNLARRVYVAFRTDEDRPMVLGTALVMLSVPSFGNILDWIEVSTEYRRQGFAMELARGVEKHLKQPLWATPGSDAGEGFCAALGREEPVAGAPGSLRKDAPAPGVLSGVAGAAAPAQQSERSI